MSGTALAVQEDRDTEDNRDMDKRLESYLSSLGLPATGLVGLVGAGRLGQELGEHFAACGHEVVYCDPARCRADLEELDDVFQQQWGNGMGGCGLSGAGSLTYLPLERLSERCAILCVQVPLTADGPEPTAGLVSAELLGRCRPDCRIVCLSPAGVLSPAALSDRRVSVYRWPERG